MSRKPHPKILYYLGLVCLALTFFLRFALRRYDLSDFAVGMSLPILLAAVILMKRQNDLKGA